MQHMTAKLLVTLTLLAGPLAADPALFDFVRTKQIIVLVLPDGACDAKVVRREPGRLTARLKKTTRLCGSHGALVTVPRDAVRDVAYVRSARPEPSTCAIGAIALVGVPAAQYLGSDAVGTQTGALAVLAASGIVGGWLCRDRGPRYAIVTDRLTPAQP